MNLTAMVVVRLGPYPGRAPFVPRARQRMAHSAHDPAAAIAKHLGSTAPLWLLDVVMRARPHLERNDPAHDWLHALRVLENASAISRDVISIDREALAAACILHDIVQEQKGQGSPGQSADDSAVLARSLLVAAGAPRERIETVAACIRAHSYSRGAQPTVLEAAVLQDADRLDALGAVGLARVWMVSGMLRRPMMDIGDPLAANRVADELGYTIDHLLVRTRTLHLKMNTPQGETLAASRGQFTEQYLVQLAEELGITLESPDVSTWAATSVPAKRIAQV